MKTTGDGRLLFIFLPVLTKWGGGVEEARRCQGGEVAIADVAGVFGVDLFFAHSLETDKEGSSSFCWGSGEGNSQMREQGAPSPTPREEEGGAKVF